ncbi:MAG TPA: hypothetical protein VMI32_03100 [Candidatus Solibacter sp.]|nr:hypothetical protein [Candidatus Solibacter sp.]
MSCIADDENGADLQSRREPSSERINLGQSAKPSWAHVLDAHNIRLKIDEIVALGRGDCLRHL